MSALPQPPKNIDDLTGELLKVTTNLDSVKKYPKEIDDFNTKVISFFTTTYTPSTHDTELDTITNNIDKISVYNENVSAYLAECNRYVDNAKNIKDATIPEIKKIMDNLTSSESPNFILSIDALTKPVISLIDKAITSTTSQASIDLLNQLNSMLKIFNEIYDDNSLVTTLNKEIFAEFINNNNVILFNKNMDKFISDTIPKIINKVLNEKLTTIPGFITRFKELLKTTGSTGSTVILDTAIQAIDAEFDKFIVELTNYLSVNGSGGSDTLFKLLSEFLTQQFTALKTTTEKSLSDLGSVPEMAQDASVSGIEVGGGRGNGDGSTFAAYPVSNKSKKNRNNGNGNSRGKGKGKGKGRRPNATKKNNRR